jgi:hypothetical protein
MASAGDVVDAGRVAFVLGARPDFAAGPFALADTPDLMAALDADPTGTRIAYSPDFGVYPVDPDIATTRRSSRPSLRGSRCDRRTGRHLRAL